MSARSIGFTDICHDREDHQAERPPTAVVIYGNFAFDLSGKPPR